MMSGRLPLTINQINETGSLQILPNAPRLCSYKVGWKRIHVSYYCQPSHETPEHCLSHHGIVVFTNVEAVGIERSLVGSFEREKVRCGEVAIIPANVPHICRSREEIEFLAITLEPQSISHIAYECIDPGRVELIPRFASPDPLIYQMGLALKAALERNESASHFYAESMATALSAHLIQHYATRRSAMPEYTGGMSKHKLRQAIEYINEHLGENVSLEDLATQLDMSQYHFCRLFKQSMGIAPYQYVIQQRVERAKQLLQQREATISDIALECGFANQSHFTKHFRKLTGITPKAYREE